MSGNKNSGRKAKNGVRTSIHVTAEVYQYLTKTGSISAEVERLVKAEIAKTGGPNMGITK